MVRTSCLSCLYSYISFDIYFWTYESENGSFGGFHDRSDKRIGRLVENDGETYFVTVDTNVVFDHFISDQIFPVARVTHFGECVEY